MVSIELLDYQWKFQVLNTLIISFFNFCYCYYIITPPISPSMAHYYELFTWWIKYKKLVSKKVSRFVMRLVNSKNNKTSDKSETETNILNSVSTNNTQVTQWARQCCLRLRMKKWKGLEAFTSWNDFLRISHELH